MPWQIVVWTGAAVTLGIMNMWVYKNNDRLSITNKFVLFWCRPEADYAPIMLLFWPVVVIGWIVIKTVRLGWKFIIDPVMNFLFKRSINKRYVEKL